MILVVQHIFLYMEGDNIFAQRLVLNPGKFGHPVFTSHFILRFIILFAVYVCVYFFYMLNNFTLVICAHICDVCTSTTLHIHISRGRNESSQIPYLQGHPHSVNLDLVFDICHSNQGGDLQHPHRIKILKPLVLNFPVREIHLQSLPQFQRLGFSRVIFGCTQTLIYPIPPHTNCFVYTNVCMCIYIYTSVPTHNRFHFRVSLFHIERSTFFLQRTLFFSPLSTFFIWSFYCFDLWVFCSVFPACFPAHVCRVGGKLHPTCGFSIFIDIL